MQAKPLHYTDEQIIALFNEHGINSTSQRVTIIRTLFDSGVHMSAEDVFQVVNAEAQQVSKATVYNTLGLLAERGVIREVIVDPKRVFYDPNIEPHHHFYDITTGELCDIAPDQIQVTGLPPLPEGKAIEDIDVIVRLREAK